MERHGFVDWYYTLLFALVVLIMLFIMYTAMKNIIIEVREYYIDWLKVIMNLCFLLVSMIEIAEKLINIFGTDLQRFYVEPYNCTKGTLLL